MAGVKCAGVSPGRGFPANCYFEDPAKPQAAKVPRLPKPLGGLPSPIAGIALVVNSYPRYTDGAVAEDRALLGSNPSAARAKGQGRRCIYIASPYPLLLSLVQCGKSQGFGDSVPRSTKGNKRPAGSPGSKSRCTSHVNAPHGEHEELREESTRSLLSHPKRA
jgi:hypothetical protein